MLFDRSIISEAPSGAIAACAATELVWVAADFDRPGEMRLRGWCSGLRAGLFVLAALVACWLIRLLAIVFVLWIRTAPAAMLAPPRARRSGPGEAATQEWGVDTDSNASFAGEVERNKPRQRFFSVRQAFSNAPALGQSPLHQGVPLASSSRYPDDRILGGNQSCVNVLPKPCALRASLAGRMPWGIACQGAVRRSRA